MSGEWRVATCAERSRRSVDLFRFELRDSVARKVGEYESTANAGAFYQ